MLTSAIDAHPQRVSIYGGGEHLWSPKRHDARNRPGGTDRPTVESRTDLEGVARGKPEVARVGQVAVPRASGPCPGAECREPEARVTPHGTTSYPTSPAISPPSASRDRP
jgi:hypothetical protein